MRAPEDTGDKAPTVNGHNENLLPICARLAVRLNAFLDSEAPTALLKAVQEQTRVALGVISTALDRYRYFQSNLVLPQGEMRPNGERLLTRVCDTV